MPFSYDYLIENMRREAANKWLKLGNFPMKFVEKNAKVDPKNKLKNQKSVMEKEDDNAKISIVYSDNILLASLPHPPNRYHKTIEEAPFYRSFAHALEQFPCEKIAVTNEVTFAFLHVYTPQTAGNRIPDNDNL